MWNINQINITKISTKITILINKIFFKTATKRYLLYVADQLVIKISINQVIPLFPTLRFLINSNIKINNKK